MSKTYNDITETIGNTPLVKINRVNPNPNVTILAKLESFNPLSSVKDRIGVSIHPIYTELRSEKELLGWIITGQFDICLDGQVQDMKNEKAYSHIKQSNTSKHILQMSIYKWLNPDIITEPTGLLLNIVSDWNIAAARKDKTYPQQKVFGKEVLLKTDAEISSWLTHKLTQINSLIEASEADIPACTDGDLWRDGPAFKYYKDPAKTSRSTKNFTSYTEARNRLVTDGSVGVIREVPALAKRCNYCPAYSICNQRKQLQSQGLLAEK